MDLAKLLLWQKSIRLEFILISQISKVKKLALCHTKTATRKRIVFKFASNVKGI